MKKHVVTFKSWGSVFPIALQKMREGWSVERPIYSDWLSRECIDMSLSDAPAERQQMIEEAGWHDDAMTQRLGKSPSIRRERAAE